MNILFMTIFISPITFEPLKIWGLCIKMVATFHMIFLFKPLNWSCKSGLQFHIDCLISVVFWWHTEPKLWKLCPCTHTHRERERKRESFMPWLFFTLLFLYCRFVHTLKLGTTQDTNTWTAHWRAGHAVLELKEGNEW